MRFLAKFSLPRLTSLQTLPKKSKLINLIFCVFSASLQFFSNTLVPFYCTGTEIEKMTPKTDRRKKYGAYKLTCVSCRNIYVSQTKIHSRLVFLTVGSVMLIVRHFPVIPNISYCKIIIVITLLKFYT